MCAYLSVVDGCQNYALLHKGKTKHQHFIVRFFSYLFHCLSIPMVIISYNSLTENIITIFAWTKRWSFMVITNATVSVDSFFVLSGLLTCYLFLKELDKKHMGVVRFLTTVPVMWLHRYIRQVGDLYVLFVSENYDDMLTTIGGPKSEQCNFDNHNNID